MQVEDQKTAPRWDLNKILEKFELRFIYKALAASDGNVAKAAELLGVTRQALQNKIYRKNIHVEDFRL